MNQIPFSSISFGVDEDPRAVRIADAILRVYDAGLGNGEMPMFPNILFKVKKGVNFEPGTPNHTLLLSALRVSARRMNPTYVFLDATFNAEYGTNATYMGCRTRVMANRHGNSISEGRGNIAFTTVNLVKCAIEAKGDVKRFFANLQKVLVLAERGLIHRWDTLRKLRVRDIPFVFGTGIYMGSEELGPNDPVESALKNGTLTIGFLGLAETLTSLLGEHHGQSAEAQELGLTIVKTIRDFTDSLSEKHDLNFSTIATPAEGLSGRFIKIDNKRYGVIAGVTDKEHYTNSFHVPVACEVSVADKISIEAPYQELCNGGHISYVEMDGPPIGNIEGLYSILSHMLNSNMGYCGFNFPIDFCNGCNALGVTDGPCKACGSEDIRRVRRVTGYFSTEERIGPGKSDEIAHRAAHVGKLIK